MNLHKSDKEKVLNEIIRETDKEVREPLMSKIIYVKTKERVIDLDRIYIARKRGRERNGERKREREIEREWNVCV